MTFEEKNVWLNAATTLCAFLVYLAVILGRAGAVPLVEVAYIAPLLWVIGASIAAVISGNIVIAIIWPREAGRKDVRDREIERFGDYAGQIFIICGGLSAMVLAMLKADHFWIANAVYLCFVLSGMLSSAVKIYSYRRGIPSC